ncbi:MAG: sigma 54-interacting transcriptional regulator [Gammaproteobacteria bacterium]|nr:sigma 54-interacting transcriptional regulator [Gammaproteobacteria bacterium]MBU1655852.1 sigma 54-interacting transcriptional regulator [Gammaproteobacteria bacterium]MBU1960087.1 sigma 54-interacting transcriptional regulator [Gammaproteobacteria bacterium]
MSDNRMIGQSAEFLRVVHAARMVAATDVSVLLVGERGTGRELIAREIHGLSQRRHAPFSALSCLALEDLAQLRETAGGTLFLDDLAQLRPHLQTGLLALLERGELRGERIDVRVIASTEPELIDRVERGEFREDLYYRLNVVPLEVPPLRERAGDIPLLLKEFIKESVRQHGRRAPEFSVGARNLIKGYAWPGNIRELHNFAERMVILLPGQSIQPENMPLEMRRPSRIPEDKLFQLPENGIDLNALEADILRQALVMAGGNRSKAARLLNLSRDTFLYRLQKFAIEG